MRKRQAVLDSTKDSFKYPLETIHDYFFLLAVDISTSDYESVGPRSIPDEDSCTGVQLTQLFILPNGLVDKLMPSETLER